MTFNFPHSFMSQRIGILLEGRVVPPSLLCLFNCLYQIWIHRYVFYRAITQYYCSSFCSNCSHLAIGNCLRLAHVPFQHAPFFPKQFPSGTRRCSGTWRSLPKEALVAFIEEWSLGKKRRLILRSQVWGVCESIVTMVSLLLSKQNLEIHDAYFLKHTYIFLLCVYLYV